MEYVSFITFIGALFLVASGIHLRTRGEATPLVNTLYLGVGAVLANLLGTTGASMLLIRPWIRLNKYRFTGLHSGVLHLRGEQRRRLPHAHRRPATLPRLPERHSVLLDYRAMFPGLACHLRASPGDFLCSRSAQFPARPLAVREKETAHEEFRIEGRRISSFLGIILATVILIPPSLVGLREVLLIGAAVASYRLTKRHVYAANQFTFGPIKEVAWLFAGIFATMVPGPRLLSFHAVGSGVTQPLHFYWLTGALSSVLDNAPTYLLFLAIAFGLNGMSVDDQGSVILFSLNTQPSWSRSALGRCFSGR
jgi:Na+/H+ antiporter NhaD/arsenite permease-like protein